MNKPPKIAFLQKVIVTGKACRATRAIGHGDGFHMPRPGDSFSAKWETLPVEPREAVFLGWRTLTDGETKWHSGGIYEHKPLFQVRAALVCEGLKKNPYRVLERDIRIKENSHGEEKRGNRRG